MLKTVNPYQGLRSGLLRVARSGPLTIVRWRSKEKPAVTGRDKLLSSAFPPLLIISIAALLLWSGLTNGHDWGDDFAAYIMQAKSIVQGNPLKFIESNRFTIEQSSFPIGPIAYPWGFPALLAPFYALFGLNMLALKSVGVVCYLLFLFLLWSGFRKYHSDFWRLVLLCLFAINPTLLAFTDEILSDIPFLLVSTFSVLLMGRLVIERRRLISSACDQVFLGAAIAAAFFIRANGILLLVTLGIIQLIVLISSVYETGAAPRRFLAGLRQLFTAKRATVQQLGLNILPYVSFVSFFLACQAFLPDRVSSYGLSLDGVSMAAVKQHVHYYMDLPAAFFDGAPDNYLLYGASIPLAITGAINRERSDYHMIVYIILTVLLYVVWPPIEGVRFLFPIFPFYISFALSSLEKYGANIVAPKRFLRRAVSVLPIVLILLYFGEQSVSHALGNLRRNRASFSGPFVETSMTMFSYIKDHTAADSTVVFFKPRAMRMMTGRRSLMINKASELSRGDYLCLYQRGDVYPDQISLDVVRSLIEKGTIRPLYKNRDFVVYRLAESHDYALQPVARTTDRAASYPANV